MQHTLMIIMMIMIIFNDNDNNNNILIFLINYILINKLIYLMTLFYDLFDIKYI